MSAAWIIFNSALRQLIEPGSQRQRLANACTPSLLALKKKEMPRESRDEFDALLELLNIKSNFSRQDVLQAVAVLKDTEVHNATKAILSIYDQLTRYQPLEVHLIRPVAGMGCREGKSLQQGRTL